MGLTFTVLSQLPVASNPPWGVSTHRTLLIGASCCATCELAMAWRSYMRAAFSAPPDRTLVPSYLFTGGGCKGKEFEMRVARRDGDDHTYLVPANTKYRPLVRMHRPPLSLQPLRVHLINPNLQTNPIHQHSPFLRFPIQPKA